eukprot:CAMPEP_0172591614 /NCGR_PEP_ID=MMETSP1068-20121228/10444_1 /TAXON_ID=35684 /ORGANISM="Pseudopedinella elastica, Strain CCMP716" /LENGTH=124 /DNA_ID=CAMNT_0013388191 /DNA_START=434 /DNA_END=809 /DNA_ORIENTATION=+
MSQLPLVPRTEGVNFSARGKGHAMLSSASNLNRALSRQRCDWHKVGLKRMVPLVLREIRRVPETQLSLEVPAEINTSPDMVKTAEWPHPATTCFTFRHLIDTTALGVGKKWAPSPLRGTTSEFE